MKIKVRALILHEGKVAIDRQTRHGEQHLALPGGRVNRWETIDEALVREVKEELDIEIAVERLLYVFEVTHPFRLQDVNLVFLAHPLHEADRAELDLVDPREATDDVLPPILNWVVRDLETGFAESPRWLGNLWSATS